MQAPIPLSIDAQLDRMKALCPAFRPCRVDRRSWSARWIGRVEPQFRRYTLDVRYRVGDPPEVRVLDPVLERLPENKEGELPHVYPPKDDPVLCLYDPDLEQWDWSMPIAETTIPWACDWVACYELWLMTGVWYGGGRHAGDPLPNTRETSR